MFASIFEETITIYISTLNFLEDNNYTSFNAVFVHTLPPYLFSIAKKIDANEDAIILRNIC